MTLLGGGSDWYGVSSEDSYKKGDKVKRTGLALVHKGERVLTTKQTKKFDSKKFNKFRKKVYGLK